VDPQAAPHKRAISKAIAAGIFAGCAAVVALVADANDSWFAPETAIGQLDPTINSRTGLKDGTWRMQVKTQLRDGTRCTFTGPVTNEQGTEAKAVTVAGFTQKVCRQTLPLARVITNVTFQVNDGNAIIVGTIAQIE
jgi:hypothetical protein